MSKKHTYTNVDWSETRDIKCAVCGQPFKVGRSQTTGAWLKKRECPECASSVEYKSVRCKVCNQVFALKRYRSIGQDFPETDGICPKCSGSKTETLTCQACGKQFEVHVKKGGKYSLRRFCPECEAKTINQDYKIAICATCGKEFKQERLPSGDFSKKKYCSYECGLIQHKYKICENCGKKFELRRNPDKGGFYDNAIYCSDRCAQEGWIKKTKATCQEKYGVNMPIQLCKLNRKSKVNENFKKLLNEAGIEYEEEYMLDRYYYDFYLPRWNLLLEINPSYTHTIYPVSNSIKPVTPEYHREKTKCAEIYDFKCVCIWDWMDKEEFILELLDANDILVADVSRVQLHFSKKDEEFIGEESEIDKFTKDGWLPVYDDGYMYVFV